MPQHPPPNYALLYPDRGCGALPWTPPADSPKYQPKKGVALPPRVDLRPFCAPIRNQGGYNDCAVFGPAGLWDYFARKWIQPTAPIIGEPAEISLYEVARASYGDTADDGTNMGTVWQVMAGMVPPLRGVPDAALWPYSQPFNLAPDAATITDSARRQMLWPPVTVSGLDAKRAALAAGNIFTMVFPVFSSWYFGGGTYMAWPQSGDMHLAHQVEIVAYDDAMIYPGWPGPGGCTLRNQWGTGWANGGYQDAPYAWLAQGDGYMPSGLTQDGVSYPLVPRTIRSSNGHTATMIQTPAEWKITNVT